MSENTTQQTPQSHLKKQDLTNLVSFIFSFYFTLFEFFQMNPYRVFCGKMDAFESKLEFQL